MKIKQQEQAFKKASKSFTAEFYNNPLKKKNFKIKQFLKLLHVYNKNKKKIFLLDIRKNSNKKLFNILKSVRNVTIATSLPKNERTLLDEISNQDLVILYVSLLTRNEMSTIHYIEEKLDMFKIPCFILIENDSRQMNSLVTEYPKQNLKGCIRLNPTTLLTIFS